MKLRQLFENFVISNDEFEDYLNRTTEQLASEIQSGKNPRDAIHELSVQFSKMHNSAYAAYQRMSDALMARMFTLELNAQPEMPMGGDEFGGDMGDDLGGDMGSDEFGDMGDDMGGDVEQLNDPMGNGMQMELPSDNELPSDSEMDDYSAVMDNSPEEDLGEAKEKIDEFLPALGAMAARAIPAIAGAAARIAPAAARAAAGGAEVAGNSAVKSGSNLVSKIGKVANGAAKTANYVKDKVNQGAEFLNKQQSGQTGIQSRFPANASESAEPIQEQPFNQEELYNVYDNGRVISTSDDIEWVKAMVKRERANGNHNIRVTKIKKK